MSKPQMSEEVREFFRRQGRLGGQIRNQKVSKKQMSEWGKAGVRKREANRRKRNGAKKQN